MRKKSRPFRVNLLDLAVLLYHIHRGAQLEHSVGFEDCDYTLSQLTKELSPCRAEVDQATLQSALWSCNLMDEVGEWDSPTGEDFDSFLARLLKFAPKDPSSRLTYDKFYNLLSKTEK